MNTSNILTNQRITISLPKYVLKQIKARTKPGEVSRFITKAIERHLVAEPAKSKGIDPWDDFLNARKLITKVNKISIRDAINKGRE